MIIFVSDMFVENYVGGAELTSEAIIKSSLLPVIKVHSSSVDIKFLKSNKDKFWIFGNFSNMPESSIVYAAKFLNYCVLEYDYKYCIYRSPEKHISIDKQCGCHNERRGKLISVFYKKAKIVWFMSKKQMDIYLELFPFLDNTKVLSSVFSEETLSFIEELDYSIKDNKWIILDSNSWVKGRDLAVQKAKEEKLEYELVWGLDHKQLLKKLSTSKGLIYLPNGSDTCPRLTIEAKLLGCELILNESCQHISEDWFSELESCKSYLSTRTRVFWDKVEDLWHLDTPKKSDSEEVFFNIIVPFYNASEWISNCIDSLKRQHYNNFRCFLIDDISTDNSVEVINSKIKNDKRFTLIQNKNKKYALRNIAETIQGFCKDPEEVNILLDGDDWLSSKNVLSYLSNTYTEERCLMTYGSYVYYPTGRRGVEPSEYPEHVIENNSFRQDAWRASHLRTFKTKLWSHLNLQDLKDSKGKYYTTAYDQALLLPLLEICGDKSRFIEKILHVYNRANPLNVDKVKQRLQYETSLEVRNKKIYEKRY